MVIIVEKAFVKIAKKNGVNGAPDVDKPFFIKFLK